MIDEELIHAKIDIIETNLKLLKEIRSQGFEVFSKSYRDIQAAKHSMQESIEACLDIGNHIIAERGYRRAEDYKEIFEILEEEGLIGSRLSKKLQEMAGFRNILVHRYGEIDLNMIYLVISEELGDIEEFLARVLD